MAGKNQCAVFLLEFSGKQSIFRAWTFFPEPGPNQRPFR